MIHVEYVTDQSELRKLHECAVLNPYNDKTVCTPGYPFPPVEEIEEIPEQPSKAVFAVYKDNEALAFALLDLYQEVRCEWQLFCVEEPEYLFEGNDCPMEKLIEAIVAQLGNFWGTVTNPVLQRNFAKLKIVNENNGKVTLA